MRLTILRTGGAAELRQLSDHSWHDFTELEWPWVACWPRCEVSEAI